MRAHSLVFFLVAASCGGQTKPGVAIPSTDPSSPPIASPAGSGGDPTSTTPPTTAPTRPANAHRRCAWIQYGDDVGYDTFAAHAAFFDAIHPDWFQIGSDGVSLVPLRGADDARVLGPARRNGVKLIPMIAGVNNAAYVTAMLGSPSRLQSHVAALTKLAVDRGYDGLDIDYEHLSPSVRSQYTEFAAALTSSMHAHGKEVSVAVIADWDDNGPYDYDALAATVDHIHIMGYDFHWLAGGHMGPVAPLGWVQAVAARTAATGAAQKFIMGIPNYGIGGGGSCTLAACVARCGTSYTPSTTELTACPFNAAHFSGGREPNCSTSSGRLYFDDLASLDEKVAAAKQAGLGGITWWALGGEVDGMFDMVEKYYP